MSAPGETDNFATTIVRRALASDPAGALQTMQQGHEGRFFDPQARRNFGLGQGTRCNREVHESAPFCLAQSHGLETRVQFQPPGACRPVEQRTKSLSIIIHGVK